MRQSVKHSILRAVGSGLTSTDSIPFVRQAQGIWVCRTGPAVIWEAEVLPEPVHGDGMFRVGWGIRADGAAAVLGKYDGPGTSNATLSGDLGSLANRSRQWTMLSLDEGKPGLLARLWWKATAMSPDEITAVVAAWTSSAARSFLKLTSRTRVAELAIEFPDMFGRVEIQPAAEEGRLRVAVALWALEGEIGNVNSGIERLRTMPGDEFHRSNREEFIERVLAALPA